MTITLYKNSSEANKINKSITQLVQLTGTLRDGCSVENPVVTFDMSAGSSNYLNANYCYITEYGRYYFITDKNTLNNGLIEITMKVDVLKTYATQIMGTSMLIDRSEVNTEIAQPYIVDNQRPVYNFPMVLTKSFSTGLDSFNFYLTVANGPGGE